MKLYTPLDNIHTNHLDVFVWGKQVLSVNIAMQSMFAVRKVLAELLQAEPVPAEIPLSLQRDTSI